MDLGEEIINSVQTVTKAWAKQRKAEERAAARALRRNEALTRSYRATQRDVAFQVMEAAYMKASSENTLPAHARQVMYAARGDIQAMTGKPLADQYFIQTLLVDYLRENPETTADWDVVFDARGHIEEPHTDLVVPLGTLQVRSYLRQVTDGEVEDPGASLGHAGRFPTIGPENRYSAILFVEKEGFMPLLKHVRFAARYDLAIMSTKGMSVTASRSLVDALCVKRSGIPLLVVRDFDKSGFSIASTLWRDTRRYQFSNDVDVVDLGLRLEDVREYDLEAEDVHYGKTNPIWNLRENGATEEEIAFLCDKRSSWSYSGKRVELNAFTSGQFTEWLERKLKRVGVKKVVPGRDSLTAAYRRALAIEELHRVVKREEAAIRERVERAAAPRALGREVKERLKNTPSLSWDAVVADIAREAMERKDGIEPKARLGKRKTKKGKR